MLLLLSACFWGEEKKIEPESTDLLNVPLAETEVRLGVVTATSELFAGISSEGQLGDYKIYNNRVQFLIQTDRESSYYIQHGGGVIDADIVRPDGQLGRDIVDEHTVMAGLGRILKPTAFEVVSDGTDGLAHLRVLGTGVPFDLLQGAIENYDLVPLYDMTFQIDYTLAPDSPLLRIATTVFWNDDPAPIQMANVVLIGKEILHSWNPGTGFHEEGNGEWLGSISQTDDVSLALMPEEEAFTTSLLQDLLVSATPAIASFGQTQIVEEDSSVHFVQLLGVGQNLGELTDAWYRHNEKETQMYEGTVVDDQGNPIAGARVQVFDGDIPKTITSTDENGEWKVSLPTLEAFHFLASGRGTGIFYDLPTDAGWLGPYSQQEHVQTVFASYLESSDEPASFARGYGVGEIDSSVLTAPGHFTIYIEDGGPAVVKMYKYDDIADVRHVPPRPHGATAIAYVRDGQIRVPLEPGEYRVVTHRGTAYSHSEEDVIIESRQETELSINLLPMELTDSVFSFDGHAHSAPSGDGKVSMEGRIMSHAAHGVDVIVSTEHDHAIDFAPLIQALELQDRITSVVGSEISPPMRGHFNAYPMHPQPDIPNNGSLIWWDQQRDTPELFMLMNDMIGVEGVLAANHPLGSAGLFGSAEYKIETGEILKPSYWSPDFVAFELLNDGSYQNLLPYYFDMLSRGMRPVPLGVSDSHSSESGVGVNKTYVFSPNREEQAVLQAIREGRVVVSRGPLITAKVEGHIAFGQTYVGAQELSVKIHQPEWMEVDTVTLYENGFALETVAYTGEEIRFLLNPEDDAHYVVEATGETDMSPVYTEKPWALGAAIMIDHDGDGWNPSLSPLSE